ncbi:MAG: bifunctional fucokinase/L-fucose-1-P-guanylyltransferase, partial [Odoribacter sp.]|nr:bifunctional fucokinase/L-fucose-1-P-guanylyltransferase [Odoribacter sp.]
HAGGQSRRLPGYAPSGKILTPIPVFRWERGQRLSQNLLDLQLPLYRKIMEKAPDSLHTLIASGDVYIRATEQLPEIPEADVVCFGLWAEPQLAKNHGIFVSERTTPDRLDFMLQKPSLATLGTLSATHLYLMDIGIWLLSDRAVELLARRSKDAGGNWQYYDLYANFGLALGENPRLQDSELNALSVAVLPLSGGEFYHYGTSQELISSTLAVQNLVNDQRAIMQRKVKPHPAVFVQNAVVDVRLEVRNAEVWIENSHVSGKWSLEHRHVITGIPENDWTLRLPAGTCVDAVPVREKEYVARPYGFEDTFRGDIREEGTLFLGRPFREWLRERGLEAILPSTQETDAGMDIQSTPLFPVCRSVEELGLVLRWMTAEPDLTEAKDIWLKAERWSADRISAEANLLRLFGQRKRFRVKNWRQLARNYEKSVLY